MAGFPLAAWEDLLPPPEEVAAEIVESLQLALDRFRSVAKALGEEPA